MVAEQPRRAADRAPLAPANDDTPDMLDRALGLARRGFHVFPLAEGGKVPDITNYPARASRDPAQITAWWTCPVTGVSLERNVGVSTSAYGDDKALLVVDVDRKNGVDGLKTLEALTAEGKTLPDTLTAKTPSGGEHRFYSVPAPVNQRQPGALGRGVDLRSRGGYVVAVGSVVEAGAYSWMNAQPIAPAPQWLIEFCGYADMREREVRPAVEVNQERLEAQAFGYLTGRGTPDPSGRNPAAYQVACKLRDFGATKEQALDWMFAYWVEPGFPFSEALEQAVDNAYSYARGVQGGDSPEAHFEIIEMPESANSGQAAKQPKKPYLPPLETMRIGAMLREAPPPRRWLLKDMLPLGKAALLVAAGGTGKSYFVLQLAVAVALGEPLCGHWQISEPGGVLLICAEEDRAEIHRRVRAIVDTVCCFREDGDALHQLLQERLFIFPCSGQDMRLLTGTKGACSIAHNRVKDLIALAKQIPQLRLLNLDPLARFRGGDENDTDSATRFVEVMERIANETGATVLGNHHTNKTAIRSGDDSQAASRGATALVDGVRASMHLHTMTPEEAKRYDIDGDKRRMFVCVSSPKNNYGPPQGDVWVERLAGGYLHVAALRDKAERRHEDEHELLERLVELVREEEAAGRTYTVTGFSKAFGGAEGPLGVNRDRVYQLAACALREKALVQIKRGQHNHMHAPDEAAATEDDTGETYEKPQAEDTAK